MPELLQCRAQLLIVCGFHPCAQANHDIDTRQRGLVPAEALPDQSSQSITIDRAAQDSCRNRHAKARPIMLIGLDVDREELITEPLTYGVSAFELDRASQPARSRKPEAGSGGSRGRGCHHRSSHVISRRQALATLGASPAQDPATTLGRHAGPKTVRARAAHLARLIRAFHDFKALKTDRKTAGQRTQGHHACQYEHSPETLPTGWRWV